MASFVSPFRSFVQPTSSVVRTGFLIVLSRLGVVLCFFGCECDLVSTVVLFFDCMLVLFVHLFAAGGVGATLFCLCCVSDFGSLPTFVRTWD